MPTLERPRQRLRDNPHSIRAAPVPDSLLFVQAACQAEAGFETGDEYRGPRGAQRGWAPVCGRSAAGRFAQQTEGGCELPHRYMSAQKHSYEAVQRAPVQCAHPAQMASGWVGRGSHFAYGHLVEDCQPPSSPLHLCPSALYSLTSCVRAACSGGAVASRSDRLPDSFHEQHIWTHSRDDVYEGGNCAVVERAGISATYCLC